MAKIFKKLFVGDTAETIDTKVFKKLTTEEPQDGIIGTWVLNNGWTVPSGYGIFNIDFVLSTASGYTRECNKLALGYMNGSTKRENYFSYGVIETQNWLNWTNADSIPTLNISGGVDIENETLASWLKAHGTKQ